MGSFALPLNAGTPDPPESPKLKQKKRVEGVFIYQPTPDVMPKKPRQPRLAADVNEAKYTRSFDSKYREGIDVSHYQGNINWSRIASEGKISYVYIKSTEGASLIDDTYAQNLIGARQAGLKVGSYHYYRATVSIDDQFNNMTSMVKRDQQDLIPIIDVEKTNGIPDDQFLADFQRFLEKVAKYYGCRPLIYTYHNFYNRYFSGRLKGYKWMIARYKEDSPSLEDGQPYIIWQYTQHGRMPGISGNVDRSVLMDNFSLGDILM